MDFNTLLRGSLSNFAANFTDNGANTTPRGLHDGIVESLIPFLGGRSNPVIQAFMLFNNTVGGRLGFDTTSVLTLLGIAWAANKLWRQVSMTIYGLLQEYLTASIHINSGDEIYLHLMKWLANQPRMFNSRSLTAETTSKTAWEGEDDTDVMTTRISADGSGIYLNFSNQEAKAPPRFVPALGQHSFWFEGRYFRLHRKQESLYDDGGGGNFPRFKDKEKLIVSCYGLSPEPIKKLLRHAKKQYYIDHHAKTIVRRPAPQTVRRFGGRHSWDLVANRPVRPMKTVVLDAAQKLQVLADMNEYLHPATPRWYANRGIPLRRGYLFHGPPGTGKTSLSFALAGVFGLDIYVISLLEPSLTEEDLSALFNSLPRRCVVLLEDIDTAGLSRPGDAVTERSKGSDAASWKVSDLARELKKPIGPDDRKGISLSGLLNAIDGVASHEGRVLIMTTNKPEDLDEALIRPGRVDLQVAFTNASQAQAKELFERMYEPEQKHTKARRENGSLNPHGHPEQTSEVRGGAINVAAAVPKTEGFDAKYQKNEHTRSAERGPHTGGSSEEPEADQGGESTVEIQSTPVPDLSPEELSRIASEFASKIPDGRFSPAEIQGFLLKRKRSPNKALEDIDIWVEAMLKQKANNIKVSQVQ
ncbi:hypothetical protein VTK73DRAFT_9194 [Phialemonium thermophilum]|uniref:Mitochondrial chaperone BCS1 n=1 Tax=Phialemonium thermophilum TaxID=223376 RepID=A0ABR3XMN1_9PEZI